MFTKTGPLAWNGAIAWWLALTVFGLWFLALTWGVLRAISSEKAEEAAQGDRRPATAAISTPVARGWN